MNNNTSQVQSNPFSFLDSETPEEIVNETAPQYQIEAYQVVKLGALNGLCRNREIVDTIYVKNGNSEFAQEKAQNIADLTAKVLKCSCMVVEKLERIVSAHYKE
ncbi:MAG TPA: hypothetical protein VJY62_15115 [Bacteroidia bacterium]|nr:hypothetical protein [Bacteroidia bacterium]